MTNTITGGHPMMPVANHDEMAEQLFNLDLKGYLAEKLDTQQRTLADTLDSDDSEPSGQEPLAQRAKRIRREMLRYESYRSWLSLRRTAQEAMWDAIRSSFSRQANELNARAEIEDPLGSLRLDRDFVAPAYLTVADTHMMPGGYYADPTPGSVEQGALMDRGGAVYMLGRSGRLMNDGRGQSAMSHVFTRFPSLDPQRILDMGCGVGASTLPAVRAFPSADVHGIDVGASILRYAHARAESLRMAAHFSQQSAEGTDFEDESFDLVYSCALIHETSHAAVPKIMRECQRLLRPGGVAVHLEVPLRYDDLDLWGHLISDFEARYNNEPFWTGAMKEDLASELKALGFADVAAGYQTATAFARRGEGEFSDRNLGAFRSWYVVSASKA